MRKKRFLAFAIAAIMIFSCCPELPALQVSSETTDIVPMIAAPETPPIYQDEENYSYEERAADLVARMTLAEKASQTAGYNASAIPRLGIASYMWWNEALHGYSQEGWFGFQTDGASFPSSYSMGASWDPDLYYDEAVEIGAEVRERVKENKYNLTMFSPTVNLARDPRWGRNDESYGEDPLLVGKLGASFVKGVEGKDENGDYLVKNANGEGIKQVGTTIKHYTANNSEKNRYTSGADNVSQREMREYYSRPSRIVVEDADVSSVMMAYSSIDGVPISFSSFYMDTLLRQIYGFNGYIVSDCDSIATSYNRNIHNTNPHTQSKYTLGEAYANAMANGLDLQCNAGETDGLGSYASNYKKMLKDENGNPVKTDKGFFTEQQLEVSVHRMMTQRMQLGEFDEKNEYVDKGSAGLQAGLNGAYINGALGQTQERIDLADELSRATIVLLKNDENALPITETEIKNVPGKYKVGIIGPVGQSNFRGGYSSRSSNEANLITIEQAIKKAFADESTYDQAAREKLEINYHYGFNSPVNPSSFTGLQVANIDLSAVEENLDLAIVVVGQGSGDSREDGDRTNLNLSEAQVELIKRVVAQKNPKKLILVMETYGPVQMVDDIVNNADAILWSSFNGFRKGTGFGEAITGKNNPSGRTNATWLKDMVNDTPGFFNYRLYPDNNSGGRTYMYNVEETIYPFGYGLSYADVSYAKADGKNSILGAATESGLVLGDDTPITKDSVIDVTFKITNTNGVAGKHVAEVYAVSPGAGTDPEIPLKRLMGFEKVEVAADGTTEVTIPVKVTDLALYDEDEECYVLPKGTWTMWVALSSDLDNDGVLSEEFTVENGEIREDPQVVTVKPTQFGDDSKVNGVSERVIFDLGTNNAENTINPNVAVSMTNEKLYGTRVINNVPGKDIGVDPDAVNAATASWHEPDSAKNVSRIDDPQNLPQIGEQFILSESDYTVEYSSNRPDVVKVGSENTAGAFASGPIVMQKAGVATITVRVTNKSSGESAETDFVVYVQGEAGLTDISLGGTSIEGFDGKALHYTCAVPADMTADDASLTVKATAASGVTVEYSKTGEEGSYAPDAAGNGVNPAKLPGSVYMKVTGAGIAEQIYIVSFEEQFSPTSFVHGTIDDKWTVHNEDATLYEAVPGYGLKLPTSSNSINGTNRTWNNVFTRPGAGDWTITAKVYFPSLPTTPSYQLMLLAWQDEDNYIRTSLSGTSAGKWAMSMAPEIGNASNGSISCATNTPAVSNAPLVAYYKLQREGLKFTAWYSEDGLNYTQVKSSDGRRTSESSLLQDVQVGLFATVASSMWGGGGPSTPIDTFCEFIDMTSMNGVELKTDQKVLDDAFETVVDYLKTSDVIPGEVSEDIKLPVPHDYTVKFETNSPYINRDGTLNRPVQDETVNVKIKLSHPNAKVAGSSEVVIYEGPITVKGTGDYGVSPTSLTITKGDTATFDLTMNTGIIMSAGIKVNNPSIATVNPTNVTESQPITVSALSSGETTITVTWYALPNNTEIGTSTITVNVTETEPSPVDTSALQSLVTEVQKLKASDYTEASWASLQIALSEANRVLADNEATQAQVDSARENLQTAKDDLVRLVAIDTSALQSLVTEVEKLKEDDYTKESWANLQTALSEANQVLADNEATQAQVDSARDNLQTAMDDLVGVIVPNHHSKYIKGYDNGTFRPDSNMSRAEVAAIIARTCLTGFDETKDYGDLPYKDMKNLPKNYWAKSAIKFCTDNNIFKGYDDGTFRPDTPISREEYTVLFARLKGEMKSGTIPFADANKVSVWAKEGVYTAVQNGWIDGFPEDNTFRPTISISRTQAIKIMNKYLNRGVDNEGLSALPSGTVTMWPDVAKSHWAYNEIIEAAYDHDYVYRNSSTPPEDWISASK